MTSINNYGYKTKLGVIKIMERTLPDGKVFEIIEITPKPTNEMMLIAIEVSKAGAKT